MFSTYFPNNYFPPGYWPDTGGEILARVGGNVYGAGRIHQLIRALSIREMERSLQEQLTKKQIMADFRKLTLDALLRRSRFDAEQEFHTRNAEKAAYAVLLTEL